MGLLEQELILSALLNPAVYGENIDKVEKIETHISCVFLAGAYAYKIKKAINLGFLDFSKLDARHYYCQEELRLNRRFSKTLYLDVIAITGTPDQPTLGGAGPIIEYAVKMRRFAQEQLLDRLSALDLLTPEHIDQLADTLVKFHASTAVSSIADSYGAAPTLCKPALENFAQIKSTPNHEHERTVLDELEKWTGDQCNKLEGVFEKRKRQARIRECHGDCHLGNLVVINGVVTLFDCLEFDQNLRWIDVMNEVAFVYMDLLDRKQAKLARRFLNRYLELSGDYGGLYVLRFYVVYRAMVRAKVHCLRANQSGIGTDKAASLLDQYREYLILAKQHIGESFPAIIITHGFSGSGKTTLTQFYWNLPVLCACVRMWSVSACMVCRG